MKFNKVNQKISVSDQIIPADLPELVSQGVELLVCNRPDKEAADQPDIADLEAAASKLNLDVISIPFKSGNMDSEHVAAFTKVLKSGKHVHAYCRTGTRSFTLYAATLASMGTPEAEILEIAKPLGFDVKAAIQNYFPDQTATSDQGSKNNMTAARSSYDVVIVGAGSGGIAASASLLKRNSALKIAIIDPAEEHFYQPGWTMVGGGIFNSTSTRRMMKDLISNRITWIKQAVVGFTPANNEVQLDNGEQVQYEQLIVAPGLTLAWSAIDGLEQTLGRNGVTSNYSYKLAPYTWELVQNLKQGRALFTQPPMPIKCAGAPQKALYLSCDHWRKADVLKNIEVSFFNAGAVLFGVSDYVPALQSYIDQYGVKLQFNQNLQAIDGENKIAQFKQVNGEGEETTVSKEYDMIHVCPPQQAPGFVAQSELADAAGWLDVDQYSLQHKRFGNIWGLGDVINAPNAKTMAAVRKQVPVVAQNITDVMRGVELNKGYDGYGSCPLTVENGKIVLAEFGYGGKILPTFPTWMLQGTKPTHAAWLLKKNILPGVYWHGMLKGHEWLAAPQNLEQVKA